MGNDEREVVIRQLKALMEKSARTGQEPRAIGGPYNLSPEDMLREVENDTELGRQFVKAFARIKDQFPESSG